MRIQLSRADMTFLSPEEYNQIFTMHGVTMIFLVCLANSLRLCRVSGSPDDRRARHGLPASERLHLLGLSVFRNFSLYRSSARPGPARRMVRLCAIHAHAVLARTGHGYLRAGADLPDDLYDRRRDQLHRHNPSAARTRNGRQPHAAVSLQHADHFLCHPLRAARAYGSLHLPRTRPPLGNALLRNLRMAAILSFGSSSSGFSGTPGSTSSFFPLPECFR